ncbi:MAG: ABC transporter permease [Gemmatimonadetes bacterium]|nr:ABC transporter permease [Gemmatimonadota bacterium]MYD25491.1 ABC transporter permease [Gemmatimonadota bacterium]
MHGSRRCAAPRGISPAAACIPKRSYATPGTGSAGRFSSRSSSREQDAVLLNLTDTGLVFLRELRGALRERSIVINVVLVPLFMYPVLLWLAYTGLSFVIGQTENFTARVMIVGDVGEDAALVREIEAADRLERVDRAEGVDRPGLVTAADPQAAEEAIRDGQLDLLVELALREGGEADDIEVRMTGDSSKDRSRIAMSRVEDVVNRHRTAYLERAGRERGLAGPAYQMIWIERENVSSSRDMGRFILGMAVPILVIIMLIVGGMYPALDATAGERERSTWETTLTAATDRVNVLAGKYLYVATLSTTAGMLNFLAMSLSMRTLMAPLLGDRIQDLSFTIPWSAVPLIFVVIVLLALFVSAFLMVVASFARTFKDAQSLAGPFVTVMILVPAVFMQFPGLELTTWLACVPIINVCLVFREAIGGVYHWPQIGLTLLMEVLYIWIILRIAAAITRYEDIMTGSYEGGLGGFLKHRLLRRNPSRGWQP